MLEVGVNEGFGGTVSAPIARKVYQALLDREKGEAGPVAQLNSDF
jgi:hypothetical protein